MSKAPKFVLVGLIAAAVAIFGLRIGLADRSTDRQLIQRAVDRAIEAGRKGEPGGVLDFLSRSFRVNEETPARFDVGKFIRQAKPEVVLLNTEPVIQGEQAEIRSPATVRYNLLGNPLEQKFDEVVVRLRKESGLKWLVVPTQEWRITSVEAPGASAAGLIPE